MAVIVGLTMSYSLFFFCLKKDVYIHSTRQLCLLVQNIMLSFLTSADYIIWELPNHSSHNLIAPSNNDEYKEKHVIHASQSSPLGA